MNTHKNKRAFTLVELIVVITILAILGTIAFMSLQGYSADARDSVRMSDLSKIVLQLELTRTEGSKVPVPSNAITLESSGVVIGYQGEMGETEMSKIGVSGGGKDPLDGTYYTYRTNGNLTYYQLMGYLEDGREISGLLMQTNAKDYSKRIPIIKGNELGVLVEQTTNISLEDLETGTLEMRTYNARPIDMYISDETKESGTGTTKLYGTMEILANNQNFNQPKNECPEGYIKVPGNPELGQPGFCVAKYEMSYAGKMQTDNYGDWNTYSYYDNVATRPALGNIVSQAGNSPIAEISQTQAIAECKALGAGYHLITNKEWMTIARNIEQQGGNWSSGTVGTGFIYNGISSDTTKGCAGNLSTNLPTASKRATVTGDSNCTNQRNKLLLSNGEYIWDFSGNVWEHVNGANTLDGTNFNTMQGNACGETDSNWSRNSFSGNDGTPACSFTNGYTYNNIGPKTQGLNANNGIGRIRNYGGNIYTDRVFLRGGDAGNGSDGGVFALNLSGNAGLQARRVGMRCAFSVN